MSIGQWTLKKYMWLYLAFVLLVGGTIFGDLYNESKLGKSPKAVGGELDLSTWDFAKQGIVNLDGQWEFFWQQLLQPADVKRTKEAYQAELVHVPDKWNNYQQINPSTSDGFATYHLKVKMGDHSDRLALKVPEIATAYKLFVNGQLLCSVGKVGNSPQESEPHYLPKIVGFYPENQEIELVIQVANFVHHKGGIKASIQLGPESAIIKLREKQLGFELFLLGVFLIMAVYHFGLVFLRSSDKSAFYFGLFCLLIAIRTITTGELFIMELIPGMAWEWLIRIEYLSYYVSVPVFVKFIQHLYEETGQGRVSDAIPLASLLFSSIVILTPVKSFSQTLLWYDFFTLLVFVYVCSILLQAVRAKKEGAAGFSVGVLVVLASVINDMLFANGVIVTGEMVPLGLFVFTFFQAMALSTRFAQAYVTLEKLSKELADSNEMLKEQVRLLNLDPDYTIEITLEDTIVFWNNGAELGYGWTKEEAMGKSAGQLLNTQYPLPLAEIKSEVMRCGRWLGELVQTKRDGSPIVVRSCWLLKRGINGQPIGVLELNKDITEQKNIEKEMARLERLNLIGQMAAGISHEVRNPMTTVRGFLQLLAKKDVNGKNREYYDLMISELDRANGIITEYLTIARPRSTTLELQNINAILLTLKPLLEAEACNTSKILAWDLKEVPDLTLDGNEIRQLILNLCRNGLEAMQEQGKLLSVTTYWQGQTVVLAVKDEGTGIPQDLVAKLGTPFLSRKDNGTGLGLAVCYGIASRHRADIEVTTGRGGTEFRVRFKT